MGGGGTIGVQLTTIPLWPGVFLRNSHIAEINFLAVYRADCFAGGLCLSFLFDSCTGLDEKSECYNFDDALAFEV